MRKLFGLMIVLMVAVLAGCASWHEQVIDPATGKVISETTFNGDLSTAVVYDLKDKIVYHYVNGMVIRLIVTPPSKENPTGAIKAEYVNANEGYLTVPKDCNVSPLNTDVFSKLISASSSKDANVTAGGIATTSAK